MANPIGGPPASVGVGCGEERVAREPDMPIGGGSSRHGSNGGSLLGSSSPVSSSLLPCASLSVHLASESESWLLPGLPHYLLFLEDVGGENWLASRTQRRENEQANPEGLQLPSKGDARPQR
jgi:hypothetical protein